MPNKAGVTNEFDYQESPGVNKRAKLIYYDGKVDQWPVTGQPYRSPSYSDNIVGEDLCWQTQSQGDTQWGKDQSILTYETYFKFKVGLYLPGRFKRLFTKITNQVRFQVGSKKVKVKTIIIRDWDGSLWTVEIHASDDNGLYIRTELKKYLSAEEANKLTREDILQRFPTLALMG